MTHLLYWLLFRTVSFVFQMLMAAESLVNGFVRHVYIPLIIETNNPQKIIGDICTFAKKPRDQITIIIDVKKHKATDLVRTALKITRYAKIIEEGIGPKNINCFLATQDLDQSQLQQLKGHLRKFKPKQSRAKTIFGAQVNYMQKLKIEKSKITPLIVSFCDYPSICGLPPHLLVGAEISFNPQILKTVDYDVFTAFQRYSTSEQRKGK